MDCPGPHQRRNLSAPGIDHGKGLEREAPRLAPTQVTLGAPRADERLNFAKPRYSTERLNSDWKRAILVALNLFREVYPDCTTPVVTLAPMRRSLVVHEKCGKLRLPVHIAKYTTCPCMGNKRYQDHRRWIFDSGCSLHSVSRNALTPDEKSDIKPLANPYTSGTASGLLGANEGIKVNVP